MAIKRTYLICLALTVLSIPLFFINIHHAHVWGDDFAQYMLEAVNIAKGHPYYQTSYVFNPENTVYAPPYYPPGFPAMIAPIIMVKGIATRPVVLFIAFILVLLLYVLFFYFRQYANDVIAACLALICVYGSGIIELKGMINSDIPCWLFVAIYLAIRNFKKPTNLHIAVMVAAGLIALLIRTQTALLFIAEGIFLIIQCVKTIAREKRISVKAIISTPSFKILTAIGLLYLLIEKVFLPVPKNAYSSLSFYLSLVQFHDKTLWDALGEGANYLFDLFARAFQYFPADGFTSFIARTITYIIMVFAILGFIIKVKRDLALQDIYFIILFVFLMFFSQQQGIRFILYVLPVYLLYAFLAARTILPQLMHVKGTTVAVVFTILFLAMGWWDYDRNSKEDIKTYINQNDMQAFEYLKQHIPANDIIVFDKPRALGLYAGKKAMIISPFVSAEQNLAHIDSTGAKYILYSEVISSNNYQDILNLIPQPVEKWQIAAGYILYKIR